VKARLLALAVLVIVVAAVAWQWHADAVDATRHTLTALDPRSITRVDVALHGFAEQRFERRDGHWTTSGALDEGRVDDLVELAQTPVFEWKSLADLDPAKIGLSPPVAVLTLDDARLEFGDMTALGKRRYVRVGDRVAIVPAQALPRPPRMQALETHPSRTGSAPTLR